MSTYVIDGSGRAVIDKDSDANLDYSLDWTNWLETGDAITGLTVLVQGVTLVSSQYSGALTTAWLSGGTVGDRAVVTFRISCSSGRIDDRSIYLKIKDR
jgi:hypothetical protein